MSRTYLLVISSQYNREKIKVLLNGHPSVSFWFFNLPSSIFVKTTLTAQQLSDVITTNFGQQRHFITEVSQNRWGILPKEHWKYFD